MCHQRVLFTTIGGFDSILEQKLITKSAKNNYDLVLFNHFHPYILNLRKILLVKLFENNYDKNDKLKNMYTEMLLNIS